MRETILSAAWPAFGVHQAEFQAAIEHGGEFMPNPTILLIHIVLVSVVSVISGFLAALIAQKTEDIQFTFIKDATGGRHRLAGGSRRRDAV